ncbi:MAG TPA: O-methyltransferase [Planctomycetaceae bacterium]|jgi:predicted O-methyltransferase YrrM|nr:O-methyltransferase [Planctomycetaceae bacterium]
MSTDQWTAVDRYLADLLIAPDAALEVALHDSTAAGLPAISVTPNLGKLLYLLARVQGAKNILEFGTLGGYSTIWLARALPPGGRLITLEAEPKHAEIARKNIARAGLSDVVEVRVGQALDLLPSVAADMRAPFDFVFIDADKPNNPEYFARSLELCRAGSLIIVDNVIRDGAVIDEKSSDASVRGVRRMNEMLRDEKRVTVTALQTVGSKGYDGFALALVTSDPKSAS